jgi:hypothetical protein
MLGFRNPFPPQQDLGIVQQFSQEDKHQRGMGGNSNLPSQGAEAGTTAEESVHGQQLATLDGHLNGPKVFPVLVLQREAGFQQPIYQAFARMPGQQMEHCVPVAIPDIPPTSPVQQQPNR